MEGFLDFYTPRQEELTFREARFCSFDFETTGLYPQRDTIIEAGALVFCGEKEIDAYQSFVHPEQTIPESSIRIHGITNDMVADAPSLESVLPGLLKVMEGAILIAHNINFDLSFLSAACTRTGLPMPRVKGIDTCAFAKTVLKGEPSYSLENLAKRFSLHKGRHHRALDDARICADLFSLIISRIPEGESMSVGKLIRLSRTKPF